MIGPGTLLNDRFLLEKELGKGGMGAVYSATDQLLERTVAIKVLKDQRGEEVYKRLRVEARIAARLLHENVVRIYDLGESGGTSFLVMEQVDGTSYSRRWRLLSLAERLRILAAVADALDYAHHQGVIHRDIKPGNVLLTVADVPKLSDFGLSLLAEEGDEAGAIRGTPHYMSPEQAQGKRLDYRTDLYSLGVMLYEAATGQVPFNGTAAAIMAHHAQSPPRPPRELNPELSPSLEALILQLLAKKPADRPASGAEVARLLREEVARLSPAEPGAEGGGPSRAAEERPTMVLPGPPPVDLAVLAELREGTGLRATAAAPAPAGSRLGPQAAARPAPPPASAADLASSPLVRAMLQSVLAEPVVLSPDERYLLGYYLAYLLVGARRSGLVRRGALDRRNADRARYLLALTYALSHRFPDEAIANAAALLESRIDVRPALSPDIVAKLLSWRDSPGRRKRLRQIRQAILEASPYARKHMTDSRGILNPGLIPQSLDDLRRIAPPRTEIDEVLIERWNRLAEAWRNHPELRAATLRYASPRAQSDPASLALWPEVVYPLIELARWQRQTRSPFRSLWDFVAGKLLHLPDPGLELDRLLQRDVPAQVVAEIDHSVRQLARKPPSEDEDTATSPADETDRLSFSLDAAPPGPGLAELATEPDTSTRDQHRLLTPDPIRFRQGQLNELWKEAIQAMQTRAHAPGLSGARPAGHRHVPLGPYRLVVVPSIRGRAAGQIAIQGMANKQIELTTPSFRTSGSSRKPILAAWLYSDHSLVIAHLDFHGHPKYVLWHAPKAHQLTFESAADLSLELEDLGLEPPPHPEAALSR